MTQPTSSQSKIENQKSKIAFGLTDLALLAMTVIWGLNIVVIKATLFELTPFAFAAIRFVLASALLFAIVRVRQGGFHIPRSVWARVAVAGIVGTTIYQPLFINGIGLTQASNSALILACTPAFVVLLNRALGRERLAGRGWVGIVLAFGGLALVVLSGGELALDGAAMRGNLMLLGAAFCWALYAILCAPLLKRYSSLSVTALSTIIGALPLIFISIPAVLDQDWTRLSLNGWGGVVYSSVFAIVVAFVIWNYGVQRLGGARTAVFNNLVPVVAAIAAAIFLNEALTPMKILGAVIIFIGLYLARTANTVIEPEA